TVVLGTAGAPAAAPALTPSRPRTYARSSACVASTSRAGDSPPIAARTIWAPARTAVPLLQRVMRQETSIAMPTSAGATSTGFEAAARPFGDGGAACGPGGASGSVIRRRQVQKAGAEAEHAAMQQQQPFVLLGHGSQHDRELGRGQRAHASGDEGADASALATVEAGVGEWVDRVLHRLG